MPLKEITTGFAAGDLAAAIAAVDVIRQTMIANMVNLTPEERKKFFKLGMGREGFVDIVKDLGEQHSETVPVDVDIALVGTIYDYRKDLMTLRSNIGDVEELIDDLIMNTGVLLMGMLNRIYKMASDLAERSDYPFNDLVEQAAELYKKSPRTTGTAFSIAPGVEIQVSKVVPKSNFVNNGATALRLTSGNELSGAVKGEDPVTVNPGNSYTVPEGRTVLWVTNMSADTSGSFAVKVRIG